MFPKLQTVSMRLIKKSQNQFGRHCKWEHTCDLTVLTRALLCSPFPSLWNHQWENSIHTDARQSCHLWQVMLVPESKKCVLKYKQWCIWAICVFCAALTKTRSKHPKGCNWTPFMKTTTKITCSVFTVRVVWSLSPNACLAPSVSVVSNKQNKQNETIIKNKGCIRTQLHLSHQPSCSWE